MPGMGAKFLGRWVAREGGVSSNLLHHGGYNNSIITQ